jgi:hypothetical protein
MIRATATSSSVCSMTVEVTYEDPEIFVSPWKVVFPLALTPGENLMETGNP